jgi:hypothetical protein
VEEVSHSNGRVLVFHIPPRPFGNARELDGSFYMRVGESTVPMSSDRLKQIHAEVRPRRVGIVVLGILALLIISFLSFKYWNALHKLVETHQTTDSVTATVQHPSEPPVSKPLTLEELFKSDFPTSSNFRTC